MPMMPFALLLLSAEPLPLENLSWMVGDWSCVGPESDGDRSMVQEYWIMGKHGMIGAGRTARGATRTLEFMRIEPAGKDQPVTLLASPNGAVPVRFALVEEGERQVVFENREHDYPQRISYSRDGNAMVATISLADGSNATSWRYGRQQDAGLSECR
ncbi:MAG: DUF6265 family protein [Blastomonas sp.]